MQRTTKQKPVAPAPAQTRHDRARSLGISDREYLALGKFSNAVEQQLGLKTTGIGKGPFGTGCLLQLSGSSHHYEVLVSGAGLLLGKVQASGQRVRLAEGADTEATWAKLLETVQREEKR
jgi:hypothetical protein